MAERHLHLKHLKAGKWEQKGEARREKGLDSHRQSPAARSSQEGSAERGEESSYGFPSLHPRGAKRFGGHCSRREQHELCLRPETWTRT